MHHAAPLPWGMSKDAALPAQGAAKQFVSQGAGGTREADDRRCVGVARELVKTSLFRTRRTGSPSYRISSAIVNSACPCTARGTERCSKCQLIELFTVRVQT